MSRKPSARGRSRGSAPLILVVDDYADNREMYSAYLKFQGLDVVEAANGAEALERAFERPPDLVVMDLSLPGIDGWQATRALKADARTKNIPVIAVTGHALAGAPEQAAEAGCDGFLTKPCLPEDLLREIQRMLGHTAQSDHSKRR
ncbi:MAG TPA: response regulator [Candidatus Acidoferrum sp.]|nr:response regulator [Candidatus Acidoferrum sp.]